MKHFISEEQGTTLVELLIALSIFAVFIAIAIGGFLQALTNQRVVLQLTSATDNMTATLEQIMREVRVGRDFYAAGPLLQFERPDEDAGISVNRVVRYELADGRIIRTVSDAQSGAPLASAPITADNITVSDFVVEASQENNPGPWRVTLTVGVTATQKLISITNHLQSTISSRVF